MPVIGRGRGHLTGQIHALEPRKRARRVQGGLLVDIAPGASYGHDAGILGTFLTQYARQTPGVDARHGDDFLLMQEFLQAAPGAPVADGRGNVAHHQSAGMNARRLGVLGIRTGVADVGVCEGDDLPAIGRIAQDFLVAGHGGVENRLAHDLARNADGFTPKPAAVLQNQKRRKGD